MTCIEITLSLVLNDQGNNTQHVFMPGERYTIVGDPLVIDVPCGCGNGSVVTTTYYVIMRDTNVFRVSKEFTVEIDCNAAPNPDGVHMDLQQRLVDIGAVVIDPITNTVIENPYDDNRHDDAELARYKALAVFDLRKKG